MAFSECHLNFGEAVIALGLLEADRTGKGRSGVEGKLLSGHVASKVVGPGTAGVSFEGQHVCGSRFAGQAVPGSWCQPAGFRRQG
jgi:hypothetical protein